MPQPVDREATRNSYDHIAPEYTRRIAGELDHKPFDRGVLDAFAARVASTGPVVDVGCGPGHVAGYLHARGVDVRGIDLAPAMVDQARTLFPDVEFSVGDVTALGDADASWAGAVAFYSLIHLAREETPSGVRELRRVLRDGAPLLVAFHVGAEIRHFDELWGEPVNLDFVFFTPDEMRGYLEEAGFVVESYEEREPYPEVEASTRRGYVVARAEERPTR